MINDIQELNFPGYATMSAATVSLPDMGEWNISTQIKIDGQITPDFSFDWEVLFQGHKYIMPLRKPQGGKDNENLSSVISLTFQHWAIYQLKRWYFFVPQPTEAGVAWPDKYVAPVTLNLKDLCELFGQVLAYYYGDTITIDLNPDWQYKTEPETIQISHTKLWNVITEVFHQKYGVRWTIAPNGSPDKYVIRIGYPTTEQSHIFEYGFEGGLMKVERQTQSEEICNMLLGRGGEKNLPFRYFKNIDPANPGFNADPDWIEELATIHFSNLMPATFRSYVQGWKAAHISKYPGYNPVGESSAYAPWAYRKGYTDTKFDPVEYVADEIVAEPQPDDTQVAVSPVYSPWIKKGSSIHKYGPIQNGLDNNDDIYPTIQGVVVVPYGRIDQTVDVEPITSDDITESAESDAQIADLNPLKSTSPLIANNGRATCTLSGDDLTVEKGRTANLVTDLTASGIAPRTPGRETHYDRITDGIIIESYSVVLKNKATGEERSASGIPEGSYSYRIVANIHNATGQDLNITVSCPTPKLIDATLSEEWSNVWHIWIKNIWQTTKQTNETDEQYAERVWRPILGDREGNEAKVVFSSGALSISEDYEFTIVSIPEYDTSKSLDGVQSHWKITLAKNDADLESLGVYQPSTMRQAVAGDYFLFIGIDPQFYYIDWAERRLDDWKKDNLKDKKDIKPTWVVNTDRVRLNGEGKPDALIRSLHPGDTLRLADTRFIEGSYETLYISSLTFTYREPTSDDAALNPDVEIVLSDRYEVSANVVSTLQGEVSALAKQVGSISNVEQIVRAVGDKLYLRKDGIPDRTYSPTEFASLLTSLGFRSGMVGGAGWGIYKDANGNWVIEADRFMARQDLEVNNLVINQVTGQGGTVVESAARMEIIRVEDVDNGYKCYFDQHEGTVANLFHVDDVAWNNRFTPENSDLKFYRRRVTEVGADYVVLSKTDVHGSGIPAEGDVIVQRGNYTDKKRQFIKIRDVIGGGYERYIEGLDSVDAEGVEYFFVGRQDGQNPRWFVGNRDLEPYSGKGDGSFIEYKDRRFNLNNVTLSVTSTIGDKSIDQYIKDVVPPVTQEDIEGYVNAIVDPKIDGIQNQIDGVIETWFYNGVPMLDNYPASGWTATADKEKHLGDLYFDNETGLAYRFSKDESGNYFWNDKVDSATAKALAEAAKAYNLAEKKHRTFTSQPVPPYDEGDLWVNATYPTGTTSETRDPNNGKYYLDILRCKTPKEEGKSFAISDWTLASNYTDDTLAQDAIDKIKGYEYLKAALKGNTIVDAGLVLSSLIKLGDWTQSGSNPDQADLTVYAGLNGIYTSPKSPFLWGGYDMVDRYYDDNGKPRTTPLASDYATAMLRMDGTGYFAGGNIQWDLDGSGSVAGGNIRWDALGAVTIGSSVDIMLTDNETLNDTIGNLMTHRNALDQLFIVVETDSKGVTHEHDLSWVGLTENQGKDWVIKAKRGLFTDFFLTAKGLNADGTANTGIDAQWLINNGYKTYAETEKKIQDWVLDQNFSGQVDLSGYLTKTDAASLYQPKGDYLTSVAFGDLTSHPSTLAGYGITDAKISSGVITLGSNTIKPLTSHQTIYNLTLQAGQFSAKTYNPKVSSATVNIPTTTSHISEGGNLYFTDARAVAALKGVTDGLALDIKEVSDKVDDLFTKVQLDDGTWTIRANYGLWTEQFLTAKGKNPDGTASGTVIDEPWLRNYLTENNYITLADLNKYDVSWNNVIDRPATLSGYGITDAYTADEADAQFVNIDGDTMTAPLQINSTANSKLVLNNMSDISTENYVAFQQKGVAEHTLGPKGTQDLLWDTNIVLHNNNFAKYLDPKYVTLGTAQTITGAKTFNANVLFDNEHDSQYRIARKAPEGGGWAYNPIRIIGKDNADFFHIGVYGQADALKYGYIGVGGYIEQTNLRISPEGYATAQKFIKYGGTSAQFLKADGSIDANVYGTQTWAKQQFVTALGKSGNYLTWTKNGSTSNITVPYATKAAMLTVSAVKDTSWLDSRSDTNPLTMRAFDVYGTDAGGPTTYGDVLEIVGISKHWQPQLWFDGNKNGSIRHRNKGYNNDEFSSWFVLLDSNNYATYIDDRYVNVSGDTMTGDLVVKKGNAAVQVNNTSSVLGLYNATNRGVYDFTKATWVIATNGTNTWLSLGNVGIGTTTPSYKLDVNGTLHSSGKATLQSLQIGDCVITWDSNGLHFSKGIYSDGHITAKGKNADGTAATSGIDKAWLDKNGYATLADTMAEVGKQGYALQSSLNSHISNTTVHITAAERTKWDKTTTDFNKLMGTDSDSIINKWNEVVDFLATYTEADTLANLLGNKADKSQLANYVTLATAQTISAQKTFSGSIVIPNSAYIYGHTDAGGGMLWFDGSKTIVGSIGDKTTAATHLRSKTGHLTVGTSNSRVYDVLDTGNYASTLDSRYVNVSGDTMTGALIVPQVKYTGRGSSWVKGRDVAILRTTSNNGYNPLWSAKSSTGSWECGVYPSYSDFLIFSFVTDANYDSNTNNTNAQIMFTKDGGIKIGQATISWDSANGCLKIDKGLYSTGFLTAKGVGSGSTSSGGIDKTWLDKNGYATLADTQAWANQNFVTALGTSGNYLTWTKNGSTSNITVPYATKTNILNMQETLASGTNLNSLTAAGLYGSNMTAVCQGLVNNPSTTNHGEIWIETIRTANGNGSQFVFKKASNSWEYWVRSMTSANSFSAWKRFAFTSDLTWGNIASKPNVAIQGTNNNLISASNEFTFVPKDYNNHIWINYRSGDGSGDTANNKISQYIMGNGTKGGCASVRAHDFVVNGGTNKHFLKGDGSLDSNTYATTAMLTNGSVTKVGTASVGNSTKPIYLNAGVPTASASTVGSAVKPMWLNAGTMTACSYAFGNDSGNVPISNGTVNTNLNADLLDGKHVGHDKDNIPYWQNLGNHSTHNNNIAGQTSNFQNFLKRLVGTSPYADKLDGNFFMGLLTPNSERLVFGKKYSNTPVLNDYPTHAYFMAIAQGGRIYSFGTASGNYYEKTVAFTDDNVASATKLQTAHTIWGKSFNGTSNISGDMTGVGNINTASAPIGTIYASNYFRSTGNTGWINQTHGGGWYMSDPTWIRSYQNKGVYTGSGQIRTDKEFVAGSAARFRATAGGGIYAGTIELSAPTPFIDFHFANSTTDYTSRIIENQKSVLTINGAIKATHNGQAEIVNSLKIGECVITWTSNGLHFSKGLYSDGHITAKGVSGNSGSGDVGNGVYLPLTGGTLTGDLTLKGKLLDFGGRTAIWDSGLDMYGTITCEDLAYFSDARLKTVLDDILLDIDTIANAPSVKFAWKNNGKIAVGSIAQYWQTRLPEVVGTTRTGNLTLQYGNLGVIMGISLANAVKGHESRIAVLERENAELKEKIKTLETQLNEN